MARIRTTKPEFWTSAQVMECSRDARLLFIGMWNFCDDAGRHPDSPKQLKAEIFPGDDLTIENVLGMVRELIANGLLLRYSVGGIWFLQVTGWHHQRIDKPQKPRYPGPEQADSEPVQGTLLDDSRRIRYEGIGKEGKGEEGNTLSAAPTDRAEIIERVFAHWQSTWGHPTAKLDDKRRKVIAKALEHYSEASLCECISGYRNSPHHLGDNDRNTVYDSIELFLRDAQHIDSGLGFHRNPPRRDLSEQTRRIAAQTEDWEPPEVRSASN
jgi:hypothetical protein